MSFADEIDDALLASQMVTGALIAAKAAGSADSPVALAGVSNALAAGAAAAEFRRASTRYAKAVITHALAPEAPLG